jgi:hypothetical protein
MFKSENTLNVCRFKRFENTSALIYIQYIHMDKLVLIYESFQKRLSHKKMRMEYDHVKEYDVVMLNHNDTNTKNRCFRK